MHIPSSIRSDKSVHMPTTRLLKFNNRRECIGISLHAIREWATKKIPYHSHFYTARQIHITAKSAYFAELRRQSRHIDPFTWLIDLASALNYLRIITDAIIAHDAVTQFCDLHTHSVGEQCPNRLGIVYPAP